MSTTSTPTQEDWVLICQPRGASQSVAEVRLVQLRRNAKLALGQSKLSLGPLVGVPFGTNFLVEHSCRSGGLALVRDDRSVEELLGELVRGGSGGHGRRLGAGGDGGGGRRLCCGVACADSSPGSGALFLDGLAGAGRLTRHAVSGIRSGSLDPFDRYFYTRPAPITQRQPHNTTPPTHPSKTTHTHTDVKTLPPARPSPPPSRSPRPRPSRA